MSMLAVDLLRKEFVRKRKGAADTAGPLVAVDEVTFSVPPGEIFGLLGPNGAGKTTTIKMISTLLRPTSGTVKVAGIDVRSHPTRALRHIGTVLTGERSVYWRLSGRENLLYFAALYGLPAKLARQRTDELLERFALTKRAHENVERYSTGMRQRICLAKALLAAPDLLILDEPTAGLDPQSARNLREIIAGIRDEGRTVLLTTHYMEEADHLCDRVAIIDHGRIIALDSPAVLKDRLDSGKLLTAELTDWRDDWGQLLAELGAHRIDLSFDAASRSHRLVVHLNGQLSAGQVMTRLVSRGAVVTQFALKTPSLEDVFISLTGKSLRE
jgi:ABC-2 type transport system ATP-binding protein